MHKLNKTLSISSGNNERTNCSNSLTSKLSSPALLESLSDPEVQLFYASLGITVYSLGMAAIMKINGEVIEKNKPKPVNSSEIFSEKKFPCLISERSVVTTVR